jgi:hypothetical protein
MKLLLVLSLWIVVVFGAVPPDYVNRLRNTQWCRQMALVRANAIEECPSPKTIAADAHETMEWLGFGADAPSRRTSELFECLYGQRLWTYRCFIADPAAVQQLQDDTLRLLAETAPYTDGNWDVTAAHDATGYLVPEEPHNTLEIRLPQYLPTLTFGSAQVHAPARTEL